MVPRDANLEDKLGIARAGVFLVPVDRLLALLHLLCLLVSAVSGV